MLASKVLPCVWNVLKRTRLGKKFLKKVSKFKRIAGYKTTVPFEISKLSPKAQKKFIEKLPIKKLFFLLVTSKKFRRTYEKVNSSAVNIVIQMMDTGSFVLVSSKFGNSCMFSMSTDRSQVTWHEWSQEEKIRMRGEDIIVQWKEDVAGAVELFHSDLPTLAGALTSFLTRLFKVKKLSMCTNLTNPSKWMAQIPELSINYLFVFTKAIRSSELKFLLTRFPPKDVHTMASHVSGPLPDSDGVFQHFRADTVRIMAPWLTMEALLQMRVRFGDFRHTRFTTSEVIGFIRRWLRGDDRTTRMLTIHNTPGSEIEVARAIVELEPESWSREKRDANLVLLNRNARKDQVVYLELDHGFDVEREDGLLATFTLGPNFFRFVVWHDRFPSRNVELREAVYNKIKKNLDRYINRYPIGLFQYFEWT